MKALPPAVIGYARVSTMDQAVDGASLPAQRTQIAAYAKLHGLRLLRVYVDEGLSAKNTSGRPAALDVLRQIRESRIDGVVVCKLDRIVRSTRDAIDLAELCRKKAVGLHSIHERLDTTTAMGSFFYTLLAALGELERKQNGERTALALQHLRKTGRKIGGTVPYGFRRVMRKQGGKTQPWLIRDRRERAVIRLVQKLRRGGSSLRAIASELSQRKLPTKCGTTNWSPEAVRTLANVDLSSR